MNRHSLIKNTAAIACIALLAFAITACNSSSGNAPGSSSSTTNKADSVANSNQIRDCIQGFYKWYGPFAMSDKGVMDFKKIVSGHFVLDKDKLDAYYRPFDQSGFVSKLFVSQEKQFWAKCEAKWQNENTDDVVTGMDSDKYLCSQEAIADIILKADMTVKYDEADKATATLLLKFDADISDTRTIHLVHQGSKWLIEHIDCDSGLD